MKLFQTTDINNVQVGQGYFSVSLPSSLGEKRTEKFVTKLSRPWLHKSTPLFTVCY